MSKVIWLCILLPAALVAAPPPNDNFADRIVLTGSSISVMGTTQDATAEDSEFHFGLHSVWWSWTAPESVRVTLTAELLMRGPAFGLRPPYLSVFGGTNQPYALTNITGSGMVATRYFEEGSYYPSVTFEALAGTNYYIQLSDSWDGEYRLTLNANPCPIIFEQPRIITVNEHQSAFFAVTSVGGTPMSYRWFFNGTDLQASNSPALGLVNVGPFRAGDYWVVISNSTGVCTSQVAHLYVVAGAAPPRLSPRPMSASNLLSFDLSGETGRCYRIERSRDLLNWEPAPNFILNAFENPNGFGDRPLPNPTPAFTSVILCSNGLSALSLPVSGTSYFFRASVYTAPDELCRLNLKRLRFGKEAWGREGTYSLKSVISLVDLVHLLNIPDEEFRCPSGGNYFATMTDGLTLPRCTFPGHVLEEPR